MKNKFKNLMLGAITGLALFVGVTAFGTDSEAAQLLRVYNPNSGEHFYTHDVNERNHLVSIGWHNEGVAWETPATGTPVHRLYNPNSGDHHYTINVNESNWLSTIGWRYEGVAWQSGGTLPVFRLYNPNAKTGTHHYTLDGNERNHLDNIGWNYEGVGFYAVDKSIEKPNPPQPVMRWTVWYTANEGENQSFNISRGTRKFATREEAFAFINDHANKAMDAGIIGTFGAGTI